jgi:DNA helicase-2/ATP-dependent DNA helicase PcrA
VSDLTEEMLEKTGYLSSLRADISPEGPDRLENVKEFVSTVKQFEEESPEATLSDFLEEIALVSDTDSLDQSEDRVVLMTIHSAKGLEFERVFIIGMEEGIFPGNQSIYGGESEIEEERRLAYVAITRAKKHLTVTNASTRMLYGSTGRNLPSRFLKEIPDEFCVKTSDTSYYFKEQDTPLKKSGYKAVFRPATTQQNNAVYTVGQTVTHKVFGKGLILKVTPMSNDTLLEIAFDTVGTKKLMANFAKLS